MSIKKQIPNIYINSKEKTDPLKIDQNQQKERFIIKSKTQFNQSITPKIKQSTNIQENFRNETYIEWLRIERDFLGIFLYWLIAIIGTVRNSGLEVLLYSRNYRGSYENTLEKKRGEALFSGVCVCTRSSYPTDTENLFKEKN
jgi:hypothetical protein